MLAASLPAVAPTAVVPVVVAAAVAPVLASARAVRGRVAVPGVAAIPPVARALIGTDAQLAAAEGRLAHGGQLLLAQRGVDLNQGEGLEDVDLADVGTGDPALVGERAHDRTGQDPVAVSDLDAVDGASAVLVPAPAAPAAGPGLEAVAAAAAAILSVASALEGGGYEGALGVEALLAASAPLRSAIVVASARTVIAHGQGEQGGGELRGVDAQLLGPELDQIPVHGQATAPMTDGGPVQKPAGPVGGDVGGGGQGDLLQLRSRQPLDLAELALLLGRQEGDGLSVAARAAGAADAVHVRLGLTGNVEVDHQANAVHVQTAGGDVGGYEDIESAGAQALDEAFALALGDVPGDGGRLDPAARQLDGDVLRGGLGAHEDDGGLGLGHGQDAGDGADLVAEGHDRVGLVDGVDRGGLGGDLDLDRIREVLTGHGLDGRRHGRGEQGGAPLLGQGARDGLDVLREAHAEHLVGLVEHEVPHVLQDECPLLDEVDHAPRGADDDLGAVPEGADLRTVGGAAVDGDDVETA